MGGCRICTACAHPHKNNELRGLRLPHLPPHCKALVVQDGCRDALEEGRKGQVHQGQLGAQEEGPPRGGSTQLLLHSVHGADEALAVGLVAPGSSSRGQGSAKHARQHNWGAAKCVAGGGAVQCGGGAEGTAAAGAVPLLLPPLPPLLLPPLLPLLLPLLPPTASLTSRW